MLNAYYLLAMDTVYSWYVSVIELVKLDAKKRSLILKYKENQIYLCDYVSH